MSVRVRPYRNGGWEVDVRVARADGRELRARKKTPCLSKSSAARWGDDLQRHLNQRLDDEQARAASAPSKNDEADKVKKEVPTLEEFAPRFVDGYAVANRHKPSGISGKRSILRIHLVPLLGSKTLDAISNTDVQALKSSLGNKAPKTVNNVLTVLGTLLKVAVEWGVIDRMSCRVGLVRAPKAPMTCLSFEQYERLIDAAEQIDTATLVAVLLGGQAGLRCGEMMGLRWTDIDLSGPKPQLCAAQSIWRSEKPTATKGERFRHVPLTGRLVEALRRHRHLRGVYVLHRADGHHLSPKMVEQLVERAARKAQVKAGLHILRHTFCSHLAMKGVPVTVIKELAGHRNLATTLGYMHLSHGATDAAIKLLDGGRIASGFGDMLETEVNTK